MITGIVSMRARIALRSAEIYPDNRDVWASSCTWMNKHVPGLKNRHLDEEGALHDWHE
jgi:hypothetical protein